MLSLPPSRRGGRAAKLHPALLFPPRPCRPRRKLSVAVASGNPLAVVRGRKARVGRRTPPLLGAKPKRKKLPPTGLAAIPPAPKRRKAQPRGTPPPLKGKPKRRKIPPSGLTAIPPAPKRRKARSVPLPPALKSRGKRRKVPPTGLVAIPPAPKRRKAQPKGQPPPTRSKAKRKLSPPLGGGLSAGTPIARRKKAHPIPPPLAAGRTPPAKRQRRGAGGSGLAGGGPSPQPPYVSPIVPGPFEVVAMQVGFAGAVMGDVVVAGELQAPVHPSRRRTPRGVPPPQVGRRRPRRTRGLVPCR